MELIDNEQRASKDEIWYTASMKQTLKKLSATGGAILLTYATQAAAQDQLDVGGPKLTPGEVVQNIVSLLSDSIIPVGTAMFLVGALLYAMSGEKEDRKNMGKDFMVGALIGVAIVVSAMGILNLVLYFIYGG